MCARDTDRRETGGSKRARTRETRKSKKKGDLRFRRFFPFFVPFAGPRFAQSVPPPSPLRTLYYFLLFPTSPRFSLCCQIVLTWLFSVTFLFSHSSSSSFPTRLSLSLHSCNVCPMHAVKVALDSESPAAFQAAASFLARVLRNAVDSDFVTCNGRTLAET